MSLLFKYLKPYALIVLVIVAFTFGQVQSELSLPDYMSAIVSNGIQYGGITENLPKCISKADMDSVLLFSEDDEKILANYTLVNKDTKAIIDKQEVVFNSDTYLLNEEYGDNLSELIQKPLLYVYLCDQNGTTINENNINEIKNSLDSELEGLKDNYTSMIKIYCQKLYDDVGLSIETIQTNYILTAGLKMLGIAAIGVFFQIGSTYLSTKTAAKVASKMRKDIFEKVQSFSSSEFSKFSTSSLITRSGNDIAKIQQLVQMMLRMMLMAPMMGLTAVSKVLDYPGVNWLLIVAIGIIIATMLVLIVFAIPKFEVMQKLTDKVNGLMREFLDGMLVIRAFNSEKQEEEKFDKTNKESYDVDYFVSRMLNVIGPIMTLIMNGLTVGITWFAAKQIDIDAMSIGEMMAFSQYAMHVVMSFMFVTMLFFMIPRSLVSVKRVKEVLDTKNTIFDPENPIDIEKGNGVLEFDHVCFSYPGAESNILEDICFKANPGETVAVIGSTGSGKSTVVKLIPRLFDVSSGSIKYNGHDIREYRQADLHNIIGYATQKAILFTGDIKSNIEFGRDISDEDIDKAIDISQSKTILEEKEDGLNSAITQGGTNVSGGQKQRLSIARALAQDKNIYIFDDSFSALDYETDKKLRAKLNELIAKTKATVFIVAQRISTIKNADKILVLDEGKIAGIGTHQELLKNCEVYKQIAYSQLSKEELT